MVVNNYVLLDKRSFAQSIMISLVGGGIVVLLYGVMETTSKSWLGTITIEQYRNDIAATIIAGGFVMIFGVSYGVLALRKKFDTIDSVWQKNRESVIWYSLSTIDNDFIYMSSTFAYLEKQNFDFKQETAYVDIDQPSAINRPAIEAQLQRLPTFSNALGFMTHIQFDTITEYLGYSLGFMRSLEDGTYQRFLLERRAKKAREILELFPNETSNHKGLQAWKEYFESQSPK